MYNILWLYANVLNYTLYLRHLLRAPEKKPIVLWYNAASLECLGSKFGEVLEVKKFLKKSQNEQSFDDESFWIPCSWGSSPAEISLSATGRVLSMRVVTEFLVDTLSTDATYSVELDVPLEVRTFQ